MSYKTTGKTRDYLCHIIITKIFTKLKILQNCRTFKTTGPSLTGRIPDRMSIVFRAESIRLFGYLVVSDMEVIGGN